MAGTVASRSLVEGKLSTSFSTVSIHCSLICQRRVNGDAPASEPGIWCCTLVAKEAGGRAKADGSCSITWWENVITLMDEEREQIVRISQQKVIEFILRYDSSSDMITISPYYLFLPTLYSAFYLLYHLVIKKIRITVCCFLMRSGLREDK